MDNQDDGQAGFVLPGPDANMISETHSNVHLPMNSSLSRFS